MRRFRFLVALMNSSVDCSFRLDLSVNGCSIVVRYLDSWYVGEPQKETVGRIGKPVRFRYTIKFRWLWY